MIIQSQVFSMIVLTLKNPFLLQIKVCLPVTLLCWSLLHIVNHNTLSSTLIFSIIWRQPPKFPIGSAALGVSDIPSGFQTRRAWPHSSASSKLISVLPAIYGQPPRQSEMRVTNCSHIQRLHLLSWWQYTPWLLLQSCQGWAGDITLSPEGSY